MPAAYYHRAYAVADALRYPFGWRDAPVGHSVGGYCLDAVQPPTGGHAAGDYVYSYRRTPMEER